MSLARAAAAATGVQVGAAMVASGLVVAETGAGLLALLRYAVALLVLAPVAWRARGPAIERGDVLPVALIGVGQFGLLIVLLNVAVRHAPAAQVSLVFATLPLATLALERLRGGAPLGRRATVAVAASVAAVALLLAGPAGAAARSPQALLGLGAALLATLTGAVCAAAYRPYVQRYGVARLSALAMAASLPPLALFAAIEGVPAPVGAWSGTTLALIGAVGLSSGIGYLLWLHALRDLSAGEATAFLGCGPVTALALSVALLGAPLTARSVVACALVLGSLALLARRAGTAPGERAA